MITELSELFHCLRAESSTVKRMMICVSVASTTRFSERLRHFIRQFMNEYWSLPKICNFKLSYSFLLNAWCLFFISPLKKIVMHAYDQASMHWSFPVHLFLALFQHLILRKLLKIVTAKPYLYWSYFLDRNDEYSLALHSKMKSVYICPSDAVQVRLWLWVEDIPIVHELGNFGALSGLFVT